MILREPSRDSVDLWRGGGKLRDRDAGDARRKTACLRCIYPDPPAGAQPTCETAGVLGPVTALIASLQVSEAMKMLCGVEPVAQDYDGGCLERRDPPGGAAGACADCPACGRREFPYLTGRSASAGQPVRPKRGPDPRTGAALGPARSGGVWRRWEPVRANGFALRFEAPPYNLTIFPDGRAIIKGTTDVGVARSLYARFIGT
jgi:molybdopterin-synthase adenylyltransferase